LGISLGKRKRRKSSKLWANLGGEKATSEQLGVYSLGI